MGLLKKLLVLVFVLGVLFYIGEQTGLISTSNLQLQRIDAKYGVNQERLVPDNIAELNAYEAELNAVSNKTMEEQKMIELKLELVAMQRGQLNYIENLRLVNLDDVPDCRPVAALGKAKIEIIAALEHGQRAQQLKQAVKNVDGIDYITGEDFDLTMSETIKALQASVEKVKSVCG